MSATTPAELLDQLDALHAAGSAGPWEAELCEGELTVSAGTARTEWTEHNGFRLGTPAFLYRSTDRIYEHTLDSWDADDGDPDGQQREADADLIVAAVNALPQLTAALRAVLALADQSDRTAHRVAAEIGIPPFDGAPPTSKIRAAITAALSPADPMGPSSREDQQ